MRNLKIVSISIASITILFTLAVALSAPNIAHAIGVNATINGGPTPMGIVYDSGMNLIITANYKVDPTLLCIHSQLIAHEMAESFDYCGVLGSGSPTVFYSSSVHSPACMHPVSS